MHLHRVIAGNAESRNFEEKVLSTGAADRVILTGDHLGILSNRGFTPFRHHCANARDAREKRFFSNAMPHFRTSAMRPTGNLKRFQLVEFLP